MPGTVRAAPAARTVRVLVDVTGIHKTFDYLIDPVDADRVTVGTEVRVRLGARNVGGWIVELDVDTPAGVRLHPVRKIRGEGPSAAVIDLAQWAAWRWAGHPAQLLRIASPPAVVTDLPRRSRVGPDPMLAVASSSAIAAAEDDFGGIVDGASAEATSVVRLPPGVDRMPFIMATLSRCMRAAPGSSAIVACPGLRAAARLATVLRDAGFPVADLAAAGTDIVRARAWASAAAGGAVVVGTRNVAWSPAPDLAVVMIVDAHDEAYQSTRTPTWHARDVLAERARRDGVPFVQLSPCPSLDVLAGSRLITPTRALERAGWPRLEVIDRREDDPRFVSSVWSERLGAILEHSGRTVAVLNRTGRARLLACRSCGALACCESCGAAVHAPADTELACPRCATIRPRVCAACGSGALKNLRIGVSRAREELEALIAEPVAEITKDGGVVGDPGAARVVIGTEAVLHRIGPADTVVFLDIDQELTAPRFRAAEQALVLLARAARLLGPRASGHRLVVQTRLPDHPVLAAVADGDPGVVSDAERALRVALGFPPFAALALVSGAGAGGFVEGLDAARVAVLDGGDDTWLVRAPDHEVLADALRAVPRPEARLRIEVDPLRV